MGRTQLSPNRLVETQKTNIGHILIFCEGKTEKFYFDYFSEIIEKNKFTDVRVVVKEANGNAQRVLNCAKEFMLVEENSRKFSTYGKYLVFDCDAPPDIRAVIRAATDYQLLISNYLFETWLLMHFEEVEEKLTKRETYRRLRDHLRDDYQKGRKGKVREIINNGNVEKAIKNAYALVHMYESRGMDIRSDIDEMNPYTSVHTLVEQFMLEISHNFIF